MIEVVLETHDSLFADPKQNTHEFKNVAMLFRVEIENHAIKGKPEPRPELEFLEFCPDDFQLFSEPPESCSAHFYHSIPAS